MMSFGAFHFLFWLVATLDHERLGAHIDLFAVDDLEVDIGGAMRSSRRVSCRSLASSGTRPTGSGSACSCSSNDAASDNKLEV